MNPGLADLFRAFRLNAARPRRCGSASIKCATEDTIDLTPADRQRLDDLFRTCQTEVACAIGYPVSGVFDYTALFRFLAFPLNNVGDPYQVSNYHLNTHAFEREVLDTFADLTHAPAGEHWGYVTSGGTEGNLYGMFLARELYPEGIVYHSEDTHYSVNKILRCLHVRNIMIRSRPDGTMDLDDLEATIRIHRDVAPIVFANIGTTMKGAVDDLPGIRAILERQAIHESYVHADAALAGLMLPFIDASPAWDFAAGADSVSISGHKMIGAPFPCGVVLARRSNVDRIARRIEYIGSLDTTIAGSRNGLAPLMLWYALRTIGLKGLTALVAECLAVAGYAVDQLNSIGRSAWRHPYANTVVFDRPPDEVVRRWQLATEDRIAHVITMPHVTRGHIDRLVADLSKRPTEVVR